jgi:hypothetical protein
MIWYLLQTLIIVLIVRFYDSLNTHEPFLDILMIAFFVAYVTTWIISTTLDLLRRALWFLSGGSFATNTLLSQQSGSNPRIHVTHKVLAATTSKHR